MSTVVAEPPVRPQTPAAPQPPEHPRTIHLLAHQGSWFSKHGEFACAITAGALLLISSIIYWGVDPKPLPWQIMTYTAFALGFFFGAAEAWQAIREGKLDIHFLMVLGAVLALLIGNPQDGAILLFLFTLSGSLEDYAMRRTQAALDSLMKLFPKEAIVLDPDGSQRKVKLEDLQLGDHVLVKPGENVPADGSVLEGSSAIDESAITGEYLPREKTVNAPVFAGTLNQSGRLVIRVDKTAQDTTLAKIIHLVAEAHEQKAPVEQLFDRIGTKYTLVVLAASVATFLTMYFALGFVLKDAMYRAITLLIVASPCALIISTPVVILSAIASSARRGIVMKGGRHLESLAALKALVFDKTGTLTSGQVRLVAIEFVDSRKSPLHCDWPTTGSGQADEDEKDHNVFMSSNLRKEFAGNIATTEQMLCEGREVKIGCTVLKHGETDAQRLLLKVAAALEANSTHPLAAAVSRAAKEQDLTIPKVDDFAQEAGMGLRGMVEGEPAILGSPNLLHGLCHTLSVNRLCERVSQVEAQGETAVVIYYGGLAGILRFQDTVRPDAKATVDKLHALGVRPLVMLTGDNHRVAEGVAKSLGLDEVRAELLPQDKLTHVSELVKQYQYVGMVGDGINDAPALARATVGVAMGSIGSDAALQAADVVLLSDRIDRLPWLIQHARRARTVMRQNLAFAICVIITLAIFSLFGLPMPLGVIGHEGSTLLVVLNGLRLLAGGREQ